MGSKGRIPPPHLRHPLPGPGMVHPDPFGRPPPGSFHPFDMLPPPELIEQKLAAQHLEIQKLAAENQRLAATHGTLRQELAGAQQELQLLHSQIGIVKSEREQQMRGLIENIAKMEAELQLADSVKLELQKARANAQGLIAAREELISKAQQLNQDLQRTRTDLQQIPSLMSELESLRQEYQHCRGTYDYEKKLYNDHLESLQVMEKNYMNMAREVEKLQAELKNSASVDGRTGGHYGGSTGYTENEASGHYPVGQHAYEDIYGVPQGRGPLTASGGGGGGGSATPAASGAPASAPVGAQSGPASARSAYDAPRGPTYDSQRGPSYDTQRGLSYDTLRGSGHNAPGGPGYDAQRGPGYDGQRGYDAQRGTGYEGYRGYDAQGVHGYASQGGPAYDIPRGISSYDTTKGGGVGYDAPPSRVVGGSQGLVAPANNAAYGSATPPNRGGSGFEAPPPPPRGGNPVRR